MTSIARVRTTILRLAIAALAACSGTSTGTVAGGGGADGGPASTESLSAEAQASPYLAKCRVSCTPPDGPCADEDPIPCIEKCTALTEGLEVACAQCIVEGSGWTGRACSPDCPTCPACSFGPRASKCATSGSSCDEGADCPPPPTCTSDDEACSGVTFAKTSGACSAACAD